MKNHFFQFLFSLFLGAIVFNPASGQSDSSDRTLSVYSDDSGIDQLPLQSTSAEVNN